MRQARGTIGPARGILRLPEKPGAHEHHRVLPRPELRDVIAHFWGVSWALATPELVETLSHPAVHLVFETGDGGERAEVAGVPLAKFTRTLSGEGRVFGIKFRPGTFRALCGPPVHRLTGKVLPLQEVLGPAAVELAHAIFDTSAMDERVAQAERFLLGRGLALTPVNAKLRDLVDRVAVDSTLLRVEQLAAALRLDRRTLERRFRDEVGVSPKWVIQRYRLHEAAERLRRGDPVVGVAADLGYADQAHFARDFRKSIGETPAAFARRARPA
jgi:AraC-like DNA-binding protein